MGAGPGLIGWRYGFIEPTASHGARAVQQVADGVRQVVIDQIAEALLLEIPVLSEGDVPQQVPAHGIPAAALEQVGRVEHVAEGFPHLLTLAGQKTMAKDLGGQGESSREQHGRPVDGMEAKDVLADDVHRSGPAPGDRCVEISCIALFEQGSDVAQEGIEPDIEGVTLMAWHGDSPGQVDP